jgi:hypothetical protein
MLGNLGMKLLLKLFELSQMYTLDGADFIWDKFDANNRPCPAPFPGLDSSSLDVLSAVVFNILVKLERQKCQGGGPREDRLRVATSERGCKRSVALRKEESCLRDPYVLKTRKRR